MAKHVVVWNKLVHQSAYSKMMMMMVTAPDKKKCRSDFKLLDWALR